MTQPPMTADQARMFAEARRAVLAAVERSPRTRRAIATSMGVTIGTLARLVNAVPPEKGRVCDPSLGALVRLADALGCELELRLVPTAKQADIEASDQPRWNPKHPYWHRSEADRCPAKDVAGHRCRLVVGHVAAQFEHNYR